MEIMNILVVFFRVANNIGGDLKKIKFWQNFTQKKKKRNLKWRLEQRSYGFFLKKKKIIERKVVNYLYFLFSFLPTV